VSEIGWVVGPRAASNARITGWSVETRTVARGDLFFALRGPNHNGNAYVDDAIRKSAVAAIVDEKIDSRQEDDPVLVVPDSLVALQKIAAWARNRWNGEVVAVTGSAGKTSTKDVIAEMLSVKMPVSKTIGNFNNHVGVPLSILRLSAEARVAVLEIGMNHAGEIRDLAAIARPRIGVVTNVGHAHMEAFDSIEGVAAAKRELIEALPPDGIAVLNADDPLVVRFGDVHKGRTITFGLNEGADVRADQVDLTSVGGRFEVKGVRFESPLLGRHSILNLLAGIAVAGLYDIRPEQLTGVVSGLSAGSMRGQRIIHDDILILND